MRLAGSLMIVSVLALSACAAESPADTASPSTATSSPGTTLLEAPAESIAESIAATTAAEAPSVVTAGFVQPGEECPPDGETGTIEAAAAPAPALEVRTEAIDNPLPDLAVRRLTCGGGWVNLKNELPSDRPVLFWIWGST